MIEFTLSNGVAMPSVGLGTFRLNTEQTEQAVVEALQCGYRMIDTANGYMNERAVGRGMKKSGVKREEIFLSTKLWPSVYEKEGAVEKCLELLDTDYIDLLYIHQPSGNFMAGYRQLEAAYKAGKGRALGISNFGGEKLARLLAECEIKPHVIQLEAHPYFTDRDTLATLAPCGTRLMAWYPLGHGDAGLLGEPVLAELAGKHGKTPAQIVLRWHVQHGTSVIPGSKDPAHIRENLAIFDFELDENEMAQIDALDKNVRYYNATPEMVEHYVEIDIDLDAQP